jgi:hypothetical protein
VLLQTQLLPRQKDEIFGAIARAGLDRGEFNLAERGGSARLEHRRSGSRFVFVRDRTWRYVGYCSISDGPETPFDRSWLALIPVLRAWLAELTWHLDTSERDVR